MIEEAIQIKTKNALKTATKHRRNGQGEAAALSPRNGQTQENTLDNTAAPVLRAENLAVGYRLSRRSERVVAQDLNIAIVPGEMVCLLGPNGAGKSTLMRTLAGLQPALAGSIWLGGGRLESLNPEQRARRLSIVLTERVDVGNLSAFGLVSLGRHPYTGWSGGLSDADRTVVFWALDAVGATALAQRPVLELSDGERQKVLIARALAQEPHLILLDEPTAFLDLPRRVEMMGVLRGLARETGRAILLSTHDLDLALRNADRLWLLGGDGLLHAGAPEDLVLSGAFERAFASERVNFDTFSGAFSIERPAAGVVHLYGEGLALRWTERALEREGYCVDRERAGLPDGEIVIDPDARRWRLRRDGNEESYPTIGALLRALRTGKA
ncbi:MAG: ABC transporter ATP-binding protein [Caldilineaceae bacterium]|nr:ABC transporter ATP-binding protein [Caldilineaceae bacterium]